MSNERTAQENEYLQRFGERLRSIRVARGFTQEDFASEAGFSRSYYTELETGKRNPSILNIRKLAHSLKITPSELLNIEIEDK